MSQAAMSPLLQDAVVHDLKNQLALLLGDLEAAEAQHPECESLASGRRRAVEVVSRLVGFLLLRRDSGRGLCTMAEANDPLELLEDVASTAWRQLGRNLQVCVVRDAEAPAYWCFDDYLVRLALDAALSNAGRCAHSRIELRALMRDGMLCLQVQDDGPGPGAAAPATASTGLGLMLCEAIAAAHANHGRTGRVRLLRRSACDAQAPPDAQGGAVFELLLP